MKNAKKDVCPRCKKYEGLAFKLFIVRMYEALYWISGKIVPKNPPCLEKFYDNFALEITVCNECPITEFGFFTKEAWESLIYQMIFISNQIDGRDWTELEAYENVLKFLKGGNEMYEEFPSMCPLPNNSGPWYPKLKQKKENAI